MKKLKYILVLSLLLVPLVPTGLVRAANDVTINQNINIELTSPSMTLILENGSTYQSMTVNAGTIEFTLSAGGSITLISADRYLIDNNRETICDADVSYIQYTLAAGESDSTIIFTPSATVCSGSTGGAGSSGGGGGGGGGGTPSTTTEPSGTQAVSKTVSGASGGSVTTNDSKAGMEIPAGLSTKNVSMSITPKSSSSYGSLGGYSALASQVYDFKLLEGEDALTEFSSPISLTFEYSESDIAGIDEDSLQIYYWDQPNNKWVLLGGTLDKANNIITIEVSHFTVYGVFGQKSSQEMAGDLIKLQCPSGADVNHICKSVYYLGSDNQRYVFPNEITYSSWYADFAGIKIVSSDSMASYAIGGNVTMRPGTYMIKITTDPKVYAVEPGGKLRWVDSEDTAQNLYGDNWIKRIVDVADTFFINYDASQAVDNPVSDKHPIGTVIKYTASPNYYYIATGEVKRLFSNKTVFGSNGFRDEFVLETDITYGDGANILGAESGLQTTAGS